MPKNIKRLFPWGWGAKKVRGTGVLAFCLCKNGASAKKRGRGRKETLAQKPLDFENRLLHLSCLSAHTKISCCHRLSEFSRTYQDMSETTRSRNREISMNQSDQCSFWNCNFKIKFNPSKSKNFKGEVLALICQSGNTWQILIGVWNPCDGKIWNLGSPYIKTGKMSKIPFLGLSLLPNPTETLAKQANLVSKWQWEAT